MGKTLGTSNEDQELNTSSSIEVFKITYQKTRNDKKAGKFKYDKTGYYDQYFEEQKQLVTVKKFPKENKLRKLDGNYRSEAKK